MRVAGIKCCTCVLRYALAGAGLQVVCELCPIQLCARCACAGVYCMGADWLRPGGRPGGLEAFALSTLV